MLDAYLRKKLKVHSIEALLGGPFTARPTDRGVPGKADATVTVSCVQREIAPIRRIEDYIAHMEGFVKAASAAGSALIVFPEYNFFDLFAVLPGFRPINRFLNERAKQRRNADKGRTTGSAGGHPAKSGVRPVNSDASGDRADSNGSGAQRRTRGAPNHAHGRRSAARAAGRPSFVYRLLAATARSMQQAVETTMCALARKYAIAIYSGSYLIKEADGLYNGGALINAQGKIVGRQRKIHLTDLESALGLKRANRLNVWTSAVGNIACPVCMDASYFETFQAAASLGADIVTMPIANNEEYDCHKALRGIWPRVQEAYVFGLKAALTGWIGGMHFTGKAGIFAPLALTARGDGVIALSRHYEGSELVTGTLDLPALRRVREKAEYCGDRNPAFEADYVRRTYKGVQGNAADT